MDTRSDQTVGNILKAHGIETAPERKQQTTWKTFIQSHWDMLGAIDFTTIEVWTKSGLVTYYLLFVMKVATRSVHFAGCTVNPTAEWMTQIARHLTDADHGLLGGVRYLLMDRDGRLMYPGRLPRQGRPGALCWQCRKTVAVWPATYLGVKLMKCVIHRVAEHLVGNVERPWPFGRPPWLGVTLMKRVNHRQDSYPNNVGHWQCSVALEVPLTRVSARLRKEPTEYLR